MIEYKVVFWTLYFAMFSFFILATIGEGLIYETTSTLMGMVFWALVIWYGQSHQILKQHKVE